MLMVGGAVVDPTEGERVVSAGSGVEGSGAVDSVLHSVLRDQRPGSIFTPTPTALASHSPHNPNIQTPARHSSNPTIPIVISYAWKWRCRACGLLSWCGCRIVAPSWEDGRRYDHSQANVAFTYITSSSTSNIHIFNAPHCRALSINRVRLVDVEVNVRGTRFDTCHVSRASFAFGVREVFYCLPCSPPARHLESCSVCWFLDHLSTEVSGPSPTSQLWIYSRHYE
ncbi:hypothetical protein BV22DRAFT_888573 [Leucogyrophana mollusca]|uniref:Uncharacterized protein n=1 Tax=Leucogyrophana mollusca TaxID=85980 RepID=A0ACB8AZT9_9AGAM|nr:hypothetical protein BV22DRAFT_888573 [Leucogyrophana mollusca]